MSLFLGNLSPRIRRDELEHVFRRFGRCTVQLKDGYGFAVYEFPPNAEKALKTLRGKIICGEPIVLSWSNRQPRPFQRFARGGRFYEPRYGRNFTRGEGYLDRRFESYGRHVKMGIRHPHGDDRKHDSDDMILEESSHLQNKVKDTLEDKHPDVEKDFVDGHGVVEPNHVDIDRWGSEVVEASKDNEIANGLEFDRYDPCHSHERRDDDEMDQLIYSGGSPYSQEKTGRDRSSMGNLNDFGKARSQQTCYICGELDHKMRNCPQYDPARRKRFSRFDSRHHDELFFRNSSGYEMEGLHRASRGRPPSSRRDIVPMRQPKFDRKVDRRFMRSESDYMEKENYETLRNDFRRNKRSIRDSGSPRKVQSKKARRSISSPLRSNYPSSRSRSRSQSSKSASRSRSPAVSSKSRSLHASLKSSSLSHYSKSKGSRSHSKSRSSSPTSLSLSVSLGRPLTFSANKMQVNCKGSIDNAVTSESKDVLVKPGQSVDTKIAVEKSEEENDCAMPSFEVVADLDELHSGNHTDIHGAALLEDGGCFSSESIREENELGTSAVPNSGVPSQNCSTAGISSEEMQMLMENYGLEIDKNDLSDDNFFASARLWPWEIIYYRRLRKGPITVENYTRRISQNREFHIVDKFVRSSSGWGELGPDGS